MMSDVDRFTRQGVGASDRPGFWVHAGDFNQQMAQARDREAYLEGEIEKWTALSGNNFKRAEILKLERDALQLRLNAADERIDVMDRLLRECQPALDKAGYSTWQIDEALKTAEGHGNDT